MAAPMVLEIITINKKPPFAFANEGLSCGSRGRTYKETLAFGQKIVVNPLSGVYWFFSTLETRGHVCRFITPQYKERSNLELHKSSQIAIEE